MLLTNAQARDLSDALVHMAERAAETCKLLKDATDKLVQASQLSVHQTSTVVRLLGVFQQALATTPEAPNHGDCRGPASEDPDA